jgi:glycosyltransferase involved in cell wall biosynthesis
MRYLHRELDSRLVVRRDPELACPAPRRGLTMLHLAADVVPDSGSAFVMIPRLCGLLRSSGNAVRLLSAEAPRAAPAGPDGGFPVERFVRPRLGNALGYSADLVEAAERLMPRSEVIHLHGLWRHFGVAALHAARRRGVPAVVSPMGMFAPPALRVSRLRKLAFWHALQKEALRGVGCFHATSLAEHDDLRALGIAEPIAVLPLGVDLPDPSPPVRGRAGGSTLLFLGRIAPIKNLAALVAAWRSLQAGFPDARLRIVGPDDRGHAAALRRAADEMGAERLTIEPAVWGPAKDELYRSADLVILPSLSESFGLVVAEALAAARPVIATTGSPWRRIEGERCGWCVEPTPAALAGAIREALSLPEGTLAAMGLNGRRLAERELAWSRVVPGFVRMYHWVSRGGPAPEFVSC